VAPEPVRDGRPERRGVGRVRHRSLSVRTLSRGGAPVQVEDDVQTIREKEIDIALDGLPVRLTDELRRWHAVVDTEPAVLVEGEAHGVRAPTADGLDRSLVDRHREDAEVLSAHVLGAARVDPAEAHRSSEGVDEASPFDMEGEPLTRRVDGRWC